MESKVYQVTTNPLETGPLKATMYLTTRFNNELGSEFIADFETEEKANEICAILNQSLRQQPGAVWIKASERLPVPGFYNAKKNGSPFTLAMTVRDKKMPKEYWENVEWLDEYGTAAGREDDAVAFAEWAGWDWRRVEGKSMWENQKTLEVLSTSKLHEKYKKETGG